MSGNATGSVPTSYEDIYVDLIGFVPPRIQHRLKVERECDPEMLDIIESIRTRAMYPQSMDTKTAQLILFGILLSQVSPAAEYHGRGAVRAGASKRELHDVAALAFLFRGLPAFNLAGEVINKIFDTPAAE